MEAGMTYQGPDDMGDDEQESELAEYEQYIEDPPDDLVIAEDDDDDAEAATDWAALHPRQARAEEEEADEPDDEGAEDAAIHVTDEP
jgi:hypothetical protein